MLLLLNFIYSAESNKVGNARSEPNHSPFLPKPVGRLEFRPFSPLSMLKDMVGPEFRRKLYLYCCMTACLILFIVCFPMIVSNLIALAIGGVFSK